MTLPDLVKSQSFHVIMHRIRPHSRSYGAYACLNQAKGYISYAKLKSDSYLINSPVFPADKSSHPDYLDTSPHYSLTRTERSSVFGDSSLT
jgi:hypothetical protein